MANIAPTIAEGEAKTFIATWELDVGDTGLPVRFAGAADRTVQIIGSFGGATITIQGTLENVPTTWHTLTDPQGNAITATAEKMEAITEIVRQIRPIVTGGSGTAVKVLLMMRTTI